LLAYETGNGDKSEALKDTFRTVLTDEYQAKSSKLGYVPLKGDVLEKARAAVERIGK
jgi:phosphate transport system substrate-binding protein